MLKQEIIGKTIEEVRSNNRFKIQTLSKTELYEKYIISDGIESVVCRTDENKRLIPAFNVMYFKEIRIIK